MCNAWNHPQGCTCGWGGEGHAGTSGGRSAAAGFAADFCRPTHCPICRADVYFISHNGGNVYVDALGSPWPRHGCFPRSSSNSSLFDMWTHLDGAKEDVSLALVLQADWQGKHTELLLKQHTDGRFRVRVSGRRTALAGELVFLFHQKRILRSAFPGHEAMPIVDLDTVFARTTYVCSVCKKEKIGIADHMRSKHPGVSYDPGDKVVQIPWHKPE